MAEDPEVRGVGDQAGRPADGAFGGSTEPLTGMRARAADHLAVGRRYRPAGPLSERPPISRPGNTIWHAPVPKSMDGQPREGALGLLFVGLLWATLLFGWGSAESSLHVLGILATYILPPTAVVALWWEDWPGSKLRPRWAGFADLALIGACGLLLAFLGQAIEQHADPVALFIATTELGHAPIFPALIPLGAATFTAMLQLTLVTEGWPLRRLGRLTGGMLALAISWTAGLGFERLFVGSGIVAGKDFAACLACIAVVQVLGWVVLRGFPFARVAYRAVRLVTANIATVALGVGAYFLIDSVVRDSVNVAALASGGIAAGLVVGMLFEAWPSTRISPVLGRGTAVVITLILATLGVAGCFALAQTLDLPKPEFAAWVAFALNGLATAVIVHVGVFRRWPLPPTAPDVENGDPDA